MGEGRRERKLERRGRTLPARRLPLPALGWVGPGGGGRNVNSFSLLCLSFVEGKAANLASLAVFHSLWHSVVLLFRKIPDSLPGRVKCEDREKSC